MPFPSVGPLSLAGGQGGLSNDQKTTQDTGGGFVTVNAGPGPFGGGGNINTWVAIAAVVIVAALALKR